MSDLTVQELVDEFDFSSLEIIEIPVIGPKGTPEAGKHYVLREANGAAAKKFKNQQYGGVRMENGQLAGVKDIGELEPLLVSLCLFGATSEEDLTAGYTRPMEPHKNAIEKWPSRVLTALYKKAKEISHLDEDDKVQLAIKKALERGDSPCTYDALREHATKLKDDKEIKPFADLFKEDSLKN